MHAIRRLVWLPLVVGAAPAHAHSPVPGIEGFYVGLLHPFSTPSQALLMLALGLLVGGLASEKVRWPLVSFLVASVIGLILGPLVPNLDQVVFAIAFATGLLASLAPGRLVHLTVVVVIIGGYLIGEISIPDDGPVRDRVITMSGAIVGANLGLLYLFGINHFIRERYKWPWVTVAFRVAAAWLAAVALIVLALDYVDALTVSADVHTPETRLVRGETPASRPEVALYLDVLS